MRAEGLKVGMEGEGKEEAKGEGTWVDTERKRKRQEVRNASGKGNWSKEIEKGVW